MKKVVGIIVAIILILMLIPRRSVLLDGGTVVYNAMLYRVTKYNSFWDDVYYDENSNIEIVPLKKGWKIELFRVIPIYDHYNCVIDD